MNPTDEIKQRIDIVDLIQGYIPLTPGGANWKARCPFHNEKSASFMVSREKGIWHCFGCGKGGDIFTFLQEMEGMDFPEALQMLAQRAGVELKKLDPAQSSKRQGAIELITLAAKAYHKLLLEHEKAAPARDYLTKRGLDATIIDTFHIGYAPDSWEGISTFLKTKKFSDEEIFQAGLTIKRERGAGYYDRFRNRIMFPVQDQLGRVIGFSARALAPDQEPKYLNTPQTAIYNKSAALYGIAQAKNAIKKTQLCVLVEGNMDVLASHQVGVTNAVAASGTALTSDQLRLIKRYTENVALAFDTDVAGESASMRGIERAWEEGMNIKVVVLPFGKDPDEVVRKSPDAWRKAVAEAVPFMDYAFGRVQTTLNLLRVEDKKLAAKRLLPLISRLTDKIEQTHYLQKLSRLLNVSEEVLRSSLPSEKKKQPVRPVPASVPAREEKKTRLQQVGERLLALASQSPAHLEYLIDHLEPDYLAPTNLVGLYKSMLSYYTKTHSFQQQDFLELLGREDQELANRASVLFLLGTSDLLPQEERLRQVELTDSLSVLKRAHLQSQLTELQKDLVQAERQGKSSDVAALSERVNDVTKELAEVQ